MTLSVDLWSKTAATNASADGAISVPEGMAPSGLNDAIRGVMAAIAKWRDDLGGQLVSTGAGNEYTITTNRGIPAHANGVSFTFRADKTSTDAATTTVDGLAQKSFFRADGSATASGDIVLGGIYRANWSSVAGGYLIENAVNVGSTAMTALTDGDSWAAEVTVASATTCDILGALSDFIAISGTSTITSFGTGIYKIRFVRATGAFTITHNATTLICPGGADLAVVAGATFTVISDASSNARIYAYHPAVSGITAGAYTGANLTVDSLGNITAVASGSGSAAAQSDQETATSTTLFVSPGRQQFHPGHPKCWAYVTVSGGTPTLAASYNITSITDTATGRLTITINNDFSTADWAGFVSVDVAASTASAFREAVSWMSSKAAGSVILNNQSAEGGSLNDPAAWNFHGMGDQ